MLLLETIPIFFVLSNKFDPSWIWMFLQFYSCVAFIQFIILFNNLKILCKYVAAARLDVSCHTTTQDNAFYTS